MRPKDAILQSCFSNSRGFPQAFNPTIPRSADAGSCGDLHKVYDVCEIEQLFSGGSAGIKPRHRCFAVVVGPTAPLGGLSQTGAARFQPYRLAADDAALKYIWGIWRVAWRTWSRFPSALTARFSERCL